MKRIGWEELGRAGGVVLRSAGSGSPVVLLPGLEGSGESCLHLAGPVVLGPDAPAQARLLLVDYAGERHRFLGELVDTIAGLLRAHLPEEPVTWWGQSFGNLLLALVQPQVARPVRTRVLVSPFTGLPPLLLHATRAALSVTPRALYAATTPTVARWIFGPMPTGTGDDFVAAVAGADPADVVRRTGWLARGDCAGAFLSADAPCGIWFGADDRLVDLPRQLAFFSALTSGGRGRTSVLPGCGHVTFPPAAVAQLREEISCWLLC